MREAHDYDSLPSAAEVSNHLEWPHPKEKTTREEDVAVSILAHSLFALIMTIIGTGKRERIVRIGMILNFLFIVIFRLHVP